MDVSNLDAAVDNIGQYRRIELWVHQDDGLLCAVRRRNTDDDQSGVRIIKADRSLLKINLPFVQRIHPVGIDAHSSGKGILIDGSFQRSRIRPS